MVNSTTAVDQYLLEVQHLRKYYPVKRKLPLSRHHTWLRAVDGVSFAIREGETLGIVGESGCGKTTTARMILGLVKPTSGSILFRGTDISRPHGDILKAYRASVQAVFQDPWSSLNPWMKVREIVAEPMLIHNRATRKELGGSVDTLLSDVGLEPYTANLYPHELSGGQRQRVAIARALSLNPNIIVLDEPVSALDVSIRAQILNLLKDLQDRLGLSYLLIAHNLATVKYMSHQTVVMYLGRIVEYAETRQLFARPLHPYTQALIAADLPSHPDVSREENILEGEVPSPIAPPSGCHFHPRCPYVMAQCPTDEPVLTDINAGSTVACHLHTPQR